MKYDETLYFNKLARNKIKVKITTFKTNDFELIVKLNYLFTQIILLKKCEAVKNINSLLKQQDILIVM